MNTAGRYLPLSQRAPRENLENSVFSVTLWLNFEYVKLDTATTMRLSSHFCLKKRMEPAVGSKNAAACLHDLRQRLKIET
jgi:hypothetical protein